MPVFGRNREVSAPRRLNRSAQRLTSNRRADSPPATTDRPLSGPSAEAAGTPSSRPSPKNCDCHCNASASFGFAANATSKSSCAVCHSRDRNAGTRECPPRAGIFAERFGAFLRIERQTMPCFFPTCRCSSVHRVGLRRAGVCRGEFGSAIACSDNSIAR